MSSKRIKGGEGNSLRKPWVRSKIQLNPGKVKTISPIHHHLGRNGCQRHSASCELDTTKSVGAAFESRLQGKGQGAEGDGKGERGEVKIKKSTLLQPILNLLSNDIGIVGCLCLEGTVVGP